MEGLIIDNKMCLSSVFLQNASRCMKNSATGKIVMDFNTAKRCVSTKIYIYTVNGTKHISLIRCMKVKINEF